MDQDITIRQIQPRDLDERFVQCTRLVWAEINALRGVAPDPERILTENRRFWGDAIDPILLIAERQETMVGFRFGHRFSQEDPTTFYDQHGGVIPACRRQGIGRRLLRQQHARAASSGYSTIMTDAAVALKPMIILNLLSGFDVVDLQTDQAMGTRYLRFHKTLA